MLKTIDVIECRRCGGSYYSGLDPITIHPGTIDKLPDELYFSIRKVPKCTSCKEAEDRTAGGRRKRFER